jgi:V8-like Glu-specific endopeptidase
MKIRKKKHDGYSVLLESWGVAHFRHHPTDSHLEELRKVIVHLESINRPRDDRQEIKDASAAIQELAKSVALLFDAPYIVQQADGTWQLQTEPTGLLSGQAFSEQPTVHEGLTGFLVGEDLLLTTAHDVNPALLRVVFDFMLDSNGVAKQTYSSNEIFTVKEVKRKKDGNTGEDWLLLRLNRSPGRPFREIKSTAAPFEASLQMLGHPLGLPMKFVGNASVTTAGDVTFECDLDASEGNSGSIVLDSEFKVVGVLQGTAAAVQAGLWIWCPPGGNCPTTVTSSPAFQSAIKKALEKAPPTPSPHTNSVPTPHPLPAAL